MESPLVVFDIADNKKAVISLAMLNSAQIFDEKDDQLNIYNAEGLYMLHLPGWSLEQFLEALDSIEEQMKPQSFLKILMDKIHEFVSGTADELHEE